MADTINETAVPTTIGDEEKQAQQHAETLNNAPADVAEILAIDPTIEKRVLRKLDARVPVLLAWLYLLAFLDRGNIGNAKIAGMQKDLHLDSNGYAWLLTIFYISYTLFEFQALMWKVLPPHVWASIVVFGWGVFATCQAAVMNWQGMMAVRFFLGVTEAGFGPGVPYLLSFYYNRRELGLRIGLFLAAAPLASTFSGALAYGITSGHSKLANWRLLFLVEGIPTLLTAPLVWRYLPDSPATARFLAEEEKEIARARGMRRSGEEVQSRGVDWKDIGLTFLDAKAWFTALMYFSCNVSFGSLPVFLPTILNDMGFTAINAQGLTAPPYFLSFLITIFSTWVADRLQQRGLAVIILSFIGAIGYVLLAASTSVGVRYFGVFLAAGGIFPSIANILPWVLNNQGSDTRRGTAIIILNLIGQCGPFLGTNVFPATASPRYVKGMSVCAAFMFFTTFLAICLRMLLAWENKKLDQKYGTKEERLAQQGATKTEGPTAEENYGADFRYVL